MSSYNRGHVTFTEEELLYERWVNIEGYDYKYQISNLGRFKNDNSFHKKDRGKIKLGSFNKYGYLRVNLVKKGKTVSKKVHRLVAEHFLPEYLETLTVNHKDFIKNNNRVSNLEMMTLSDNVVDYILKIKKPLSSSKHIGVSFHKNLNRWVSSLVVDGEPTSLGSYKKEQQAVEAIELYIAGKLKPLKKLGGVKISIEKIKDIIYLSTRTDIINIIRLTNISHSTVIKYIGIYKDIDLEDYKPPLEWINVDFFKPKVGKDNYKYIERIGRVFYKEDGTSYTITDCEGDKYTVQFNDGTIVQNIAYETLRRKRLHNPNTPTKSGLGFIGQGFYTTESKKEYKVWENLLRRVEDGKVNIDKKWYNFQIFAEFFNRKFGSRDTFGLRVCSDKIIKGIPYIDEDTFYLLTASEYNDKYKTLKQYK